MAHEEADPLRDAVEPRLGLPFPPERDALPHAEREHADRDDRERVEQELRPRGTFQKVSRNGTSERAAAAVGFTLSDYSTPPRRGSRRAASPRITAQIAGRAGVAPRSSGSPCRGRPGRPRRRPAAARARPPSASARSTSWRSSARMSVAQLARPARLSPPLQRAARLERGPVAPDRVQELGDARRRGRPRSSRMGTSQSRSREACWPSRWRWTMYLSSVTSRGAPSRSALFTTRMSAASRRPAFMVWMPSPDSGTSTTTVVSASRTMSSSVWPTPTVSTRIQSNPAASRSFCVSAGGAGQPAQAAARRHAADEDARIERVGLHADPVAQDRAAGERAGRDRPRRRRPSRPSSGSPPGAGRPACSSPPPAGR